MGYTSRMLYLLGELRREMNGEVSSAMRYHGTAYGLNYGVSLPTLRRLARAEVCDHEFAKYLYQQDIRELRLAALHIADTKQVTSPEFAFWAAGIINSEVAEEAAFALLSRISPFSELFCQWIACENRLLQYAVLMAAARSQELLLDYLVPALEVVRRNSDDLLIAQGVVVLLAALAKKEEYRQAVSRAADTLGVSPSEDFVHEEIAWRLKD